MHGLQRLGATAQLLELGQNQAPASSSACAPTSAASTTRRTRNTCPEQSNGELPSGDSDATVIVVATVNERGGQIGGLISARLQQATSADFNGTTHIACKAGVFLTAGTSGEGDLGCSVRASCPPGAVNCFTTLPPNEIDDARINVPEEASQVLEAQVDYAARGRRQGVVRGDHLHAGGHGVGVERLSRRISRRSLTASPAAFARPGLRSPGSQTPQPAPLAALRLATLGRVHEPGRTTRLDHAHRRVAQHEAVARDRIRQRCAGRSPHPPDGLQKTLWLPNPPSRTSTRSHARRRRR